ncbi:MAG TPA: helix-turn-helix transcriptional regulator [Pyrinomonadaceae bacterium]
MGKSRRSKPARLTEKLLQIRTRLGLSQNQIIRRLGLSEELYQASISGYELGTREPPLPILLKYSEIAGVCMDVLINDKLDLPEKLPSVPDHEESARASASRVRRKR